MDEELKQLLDEARSMGATATQLYDLLNRYNTKKKSGGETSLEKPLPTSKPTPSPFAAQSQLAEQTSEFATPFYGHDAPKITGSNGAVIPINKRSIPITPFANDDSYLNGLQERINTGSTTEQDNRFLDKNTRGDYFDLSDEGRVQEVASRYESLAKDKPFSDSFKSISEKIAAIDLVKKAAEQTDYVGGGSTFGTGGFKGLSDEQKSDLATLEDARQKLIKEKQLTDTIPVYKEAVVETRPGSNFLQRMGESLPKWSAIDWLANKAIDTFYGEDQAPIVEKKLEQLPVGFSSGMNQLKYSDPEKFKKYTKYLIDGQPISASDVAIISNDGLDAIESAAKFSFIKNEIPKDVFETQMLNIGQERTKTLLDNKEVLYAVLSDGIANSIDGSNIARTATADVNMMAVNELFGHKWNYSDEEIALYGKQYARSLGIDPNDARVQAAIKKLQDNEGWMPFENSIAKSGNIRDITKGAGSVISGVNSTIQNIGLSEAERFSEGIAQGNADVFEKKLKSVENDTVRNAMAGIFEGVKGTLKVTGTEIGEELVTQLGDFAANATWNPYSKHYKNRDLLN